MLPIPLDQTSPASNASKTVSETSPKVAPSQKCTRREFRIAGVDQALLPQVLSRLKVAGITAQSRPDDLDEAVRGIINEAVAST